MALKEKRSGRTESVPIQDFQHKLVPEIPAEAASRLPGLEGWASGMRDELDILLKNLWRKSLDTAQDIEIRFRDIALLPGPKGEKGDPGEKGDQGDRGEDGVIGVDGQDGQDGIDATGVGLSVLNPDNGLYYIWQPRLSGIDVVGSWIETPTPPDADLAIKNPDDGLFYRWTPRLAGDGVTVVGMWEPV